jgi:membrane-associated phospholipid phosphatase
MATLDALARAAPIARRAGFRAAPKGARSWIDLVLVAWIGWFYDPMNNLAEVRQSLAERHARTILHLERALHLDPELTLNRSLAHHHALREVAVLWYNDVHGLVVLGVFGWLWWHRPDLLPHLRWALIAVSAVALVAFWCYPVAPPRMLVGRGYLDLVAVVEGMPPWHAGAVAAESNQLASMPSLHLAWGLWAAIALWRCFPDRRVRAAVVVYPFITLWVVMATGNHFLLDGIIGAALTAVVVPLADRLTARRARSGKDSRAGAS